MDTAIDIAKLEGMKYAELRTIAKAVGIKANMKADKLLKALSEYAAVQQKDVGTIRAKTPKTKKKDAKSEEPLEDMVTARRGGKNVKTTTDVPTKSQVLTPVQVKALNHSLSKPRTPLSAQRRMLTPSSAKQRTPLHRLRTPPSRKSSPAVRTPSSAIGIKRVRSVEQEAVVEKPGNKRQRLSKDEGETNTGTPRAKRTRRNTYELEESDVQSPKPVVGSPGTKEIIESMDDNLTEGEMKEQLLNALDKKVQNKLGSQSTQIPRFVAFAQMKKQEACASLTPGQQRWQKIHAKQFDKMESIDTYLEKKKKRVEIVNGSAQKAKTVAEQTSSVLKKMKKMHTPATETKTDSKTCTTLFKTPVHDGVPFIPKVTSVSKVNFNFSSTKTTPGLLSSAARKSPRGQVVETKENLKLEAKMTGGQRKSVGLTPGQRKSLGASVSKRKSAAITPFKFNATLNQSMGHNTSNVSNKSMSKNRFDLAASLARPMTWKPHTGKLKPFLTGPVSTHQRDVKAVKVTTKEERRQKSRAAQSTKRHATQMNRRGIKA